MVGVKKVGTTDVQFTESIVLINLGRSGLVLETESRVK